MRILEVQRFPTLFMLFYKAQVRFRSTTPAASLQLQSIQMQNPEPGNPARGFNKNWIKDNYKVCRTALNLRAKTARPARLRAISARVAPLSGVVL